MSAKTGAFVLAPVEGPVQLQGARVDDLLVMTSHGDQAIYMGCGQGAAPSIMFTGSNIILNKHTTAAAMTVEALDIANLIVGSNVIIQGTESLIPSGPLAQTFVLVPPISFTDVPATGGVFSLDQTLEPGNPGSKLTAGSSVNGFLVGASAKWSKARFVIRGTWLTDSAGLTNTVEVRDEAGATVATASLTNTPVQAAGYFFFVTGWFTYASVSSSSKIDLVNNGSSPLRISSVHIQLV